MSARDRDVVLVLAVAAVLAVGCGGTRGAGEDASGVGSEPGSPSGPTKTEVRGSLEGSSFVLYYSAIRRAPNDPRTFVCAANVPITWTQCERFEPPDRHMLVAPFFYDNQTGAPRWDFSTVFLYKVGSNARTAWGDSGTIEVFEDDPTTGAVRLTFNIDFGQSEMTSGSIVYP